MTPKKQGLLTVFALLLTIATAARFIGGSAGSKGANLIPPNWTLEEVGTSGYEASRFKDISQRVKLHPDEFVITKFSHRQNFYSWEVIGDNRAEAYFLEGAEGVLDSHGRLSRVDLGADAANLRSRLTDLKQAVYSDSKPAWLKLSPPHKEPLSASPWSLFFTGKDGPRVFSFLAKDGENVELINLISDPIIKFNSSN